MQPAFPPIDLPTEQVALVYQVPELSVDSSRLSAEKAKALVFSAER